MALIRRSVLVVTAACLLGTTVSMPVLAAPQAATAAGLVTTDEVLRDGTVQDTVAALLMRADVRAALAERGVDPAQVQARVAALSDDEARQLAEQIDQLPAGGDVLGYVFLVFVILLITDILGFTKIFPFTRPIR